MGNGTLIIEPQVEAQTPLQSYLSKTNLLLLPSSNVCMNLVRIRSSDPDTYKLDHLIHNQEFIHFAHSWFAEQNRKDGQSPLFQHVLRSACDAAQTGCPSAIVLALMLKHALQKKETGSSLRKNKIFSLIEGTGSAELKKICRELERISQLAAGLEMTDGEKRKNYKERLTAKLDYLKKLSPEALLAEFFSKKDNLAFDMQNVRLQGRSYLKNFHCPPSQLYNFYKQTAAIFYDRLASLFPDLQPMFLEYGNNVDVFETLII